MRMKNVWCMPAVLLLINLSCKHEIKPDLKKQKQTLVFVTSNAIQTGTTLQAKALSNVNYKGIITYAIEKISGDFDVNLSSSNQISSVKGEGKFILTATAPADENYLEAKEKLEITIAKKVIPEQLYIKKSAPYKLKINDQVLGSDLFGFYGHSSCIKLSVKNLHGYGRERARVIGNQIEFVHAGDVIIIATSTGGHARELTYVNGMSGYEDIIYGSASKEHRILVTKLPGMVQFPYTRNMKLYSYSPNKKIVATRIGDGVIRYHISWANRSGVANIDSATGELTLNKTGQIRIKATVDATNNYEAAFAETEIITIEK